MDQKPLFVQIYTDKFGKEISVVAANRIYIHIYDARRYLLPHAVCPDAFIMIS